MNALFVDDVGLLCAPEPGSTVLDGVTRRSIIELARDAGVSVSEAPMLWSDPSDGPGGRQGALLATSTAAGMVVVDEVREKSPSGKVWSWQSSPKNEVLVELRELADSCFWGNGRPEWWADSDQLLRGAQSPR